MYNSSVRVLRMPGDPVFNDIFPSFLNSSSQFYSIIFLYRSFCVFPNKLSTTALIVSQLNTLDDWLWNLKLNKVSISSKCSTSGFHYKSTNTHSWSCEMQKEQIFTYTNK